MHKNGFKLVEERQLAEVGGIARLWIHEQCGAQVLSICNEDENKCFGANFFTPPENSTGVAHILEHSVLCGSDRYPVKEPFVELLKGSLQTFLNAFTFPDKTCYPVASANLQDFYNLINVYLDAVFHPLISRDIFSQEGWHIEADAIDSPWIYKGVVYNEMKGVYSSPDSILAEQSQQSVFPDNLYSLDSGGNPEIIPSLTYEAFVDFHHLYYQPGNTRFFFWGNDPEDERLRILEPYVSGHSCVSGLPVVALQKKLAKPRYVEVPYAAGENDSRSLFTVNWLLGERADVSLAMKMEMLEHILESMPGSPLRRALIESGLGEDTTGCGLEMDLRQMYYSTGLKGIAPADVDKAEKLIMDTLANLVEKGIDHMAVEAAVNSVEFAYRENNSGRFPRGLAAMVQSLSSWLYGGDPLAPLAWEKPLGEIRKAVASGEKIFEDAIKTWFLDNTHRVRVTLLPNKNLAKAREAREAATLAAIQQEKSPASREELVRETQRLQAAQLKPDSPEDLAKIPALGIRDLPEKNALIPRDISKIPQTFIAHDLPTNGIAYTSLLLPIKRLPVRLLPLLPLFCRSFLDWGTAREDYGQLGMRIASRLGGLGVSALSGNNLETGDIFCYLAFTGKVVYGNLEDMFDILREIILEPQKDESLILPRLGQMLMEDKSRLEISLMAAGHAAASMRVGARYRGQNALLEQTAGISQLRFLNDLENRLASDPQSVLSDFAQLRELVIGSRDAVFDCAAENDSLGKTRDMAASLFAELPAKPVLDSGDAIATWPSMSNLPAAEAFLTPGQVNYVAKGANLYDLGYKYNGSVNVIMRWLRMGRLWEDVRVAGGAYGVSCSFERTGGNAVCSSYRDPNVDKTLSAYDGLGPYLQKFTPTNAQLSQAIVGAVGDLDTYLLPDARAAKSLLLWLGGLDEEKRQKSREEMLATTAKDFHDFASLMQAMAQEGAICVIGGSTAEKASKEHGWTSEQLVQNPLD